MSTFDNREFEKYNDEAKAKWGSTSAYKEYSEKSKDYSGDKFSALAGGMDSIMCEFSHFMKEGYPAFSDEVQELCGELQKYITDNFYTCTKEILAGLGQMYVCDERFRNNLDKHGKGTAQYISSAVEYFCR